MRNVSLHEVAEATGGSLVGDGRSLIKSVSTDTREMREGSLFFALKGSRFDGHAFLDHAASGGAAAAVVSARSRYVAEFHKGRPGYPLIKVRDTLRAMGDLAGHVRGTLDLKVAGITGTTGKTCTKDFLVSIMSKAMRVTHSPGNYNNEIGLPLTIFEVKDKDRALVLEMGARRPGDIRRLAEIARPGFGVITNVGPGHLELFKSEDEVARTKAELAQAVPEEGVVVLNSDDARTGWIASKCRARVIRFGASRDADFRASRVVMDDMARPSFNLRGPGIDIEVGLKGAGSRQVENAIAAAACAFAMGAGQEEIAEGLSSASLSPWRMEAQEAPGGFLVINDAYNANPLSVRSALETLGGLAEKRRTIAVLGGMAELGSRSREFHEEVGALAARSDLDILVTVGRQARSYATAALAEGMPKGSVFRCRDIEEAESVLAAVVEPGDAVLVKASRVAGLEGLAGKLLERGFIADRVVAGV